MKKAWASKNQGFTIVELLIVIVVIAILAAITTVAFNGVINRSREAAITADLRANAQKVRSYNAINGHNPNIVEQAASTEFKFIFSSSGNYKLKSYCWSDGEGFAFGAETATGNRYYAVSGGSVVHDNTISLLGICALKGVTNTNGTAATAAYIGVSTTACASEGGTCVVTGTKHVIYGANGKYNVKLNVTGSISCSNGVFGDPIGGVVKACYTADP